MKPHNPGVCQVCDMFENVGYWGPPVGLVPDHKRLFWPPDEGPTGVDDEADTKGQGL